MEGILAPCERVLAMEGPGGFRSVRGECLHAHLPALVSWSVGDSGVGMVRSFEVWNPEVFQPQLHPLRDSGSLDDADAIWGLWGAFCILKL